MTDPVASAWIAVQRRLVNSLSCVRIVALFALVIAATFFISSLRYVPGSIYPRQLA